MKKPARGSYKEAKMIQAKKKDIASRIADKIYEGINLLKPKIK